MIGQIPFSRSFLEARLHLKEPRRETLLAVEAGSKLLDVNRGDLVLIDRDQANLARDGIYLADLPGINCVEFSDSPIERFVSSDRGTGCGSVELYSRSFTFQKIPAPVPCYRQTVP